MSSNKALYRRFIDEVFNQGRVERINEFLAPNYVLRDAPPGSPASVEGVVSIVQLFRSAFPDLAISIEEQVGEGEYVCSRTVTRGTHRGPIFGLAPTGRTIAVPGLTLVRVVDGRLVESTVKNDMLILLKQLGATTLP
jgi:predicted ester cyclase